MSDQPVCNTCAPRALPGDGPICGPCVFSEDKPPTNWAALEANSSDPLADQRRLEWLLPVMSLAGDQANVGVARTLALGAALMLGKTDRDAIDFAMEGSP